MENSPVIQEFLSYLSNERRFSDYTAKCYGADLKQYGAFLAGYNSTSGADFSDTENGAMQAESDSEDTAATAVEHKTDVSLQGVNAPGGQ
jgi:site-specific recombinase XerD